MNARTAAEQNPGKADSLLPRRVQLVWAVRKLQELDMLDQATVNAVRSVRFCPGLNSQLATVLAKSSKCGYSMFGVSDDLGRIVTVTVQWCPVQ